MTTLTISVSDERYHRLKEVAVGLGVSPEDLVRASIDDLISLPDVDFLSKMGHVLVKNAELYRRLS